MLGRQQMDGFPEKVFVRDAGVQLVKPQHRLDVSPLGGRPFCPVGAFAPFHLPVEIVVEFPVAIEGALQAVLAPPPLFPAGRHFLPFFSPGGWVLFHAWVPRAAKTTVPGAGCEQFWGSNVWSAVRWCKRRESNTRCGM